MMGLEVDVVFKCALCSYTMCQTLVVAIVRVTVRVRAGLAGRRFCYSTFKCHYARL